jgi:hypothetical protein
MVILNQGKEELQEKGKKTERTIATDTPEKRLN